MQHNIAANEPGGRTDSLVAPVASPAPLGLNMIALVTAVIGCFYANFIVPYGIPSVQQAIGVVAFILGIVLVLAGMWEFRKNYMVTATLFTSYGGFLAAFGLILWSTVYGVLAGAGTLHVTLGLIFLCWTIFTGIVCLGTFRTNGSLVGTVFFLFLTYLLLCIGELASGNVVLLHIGGWLGIVCALIAWFAALASILAIASPNEAFRLPLGRRVAAIE
jgi:succinate-acetate transporter protein